MSDFFTMRAACKRCSKDQGHIQTRNGQDCVFCGQCGAFQYNAPKTETGREVRKMDTGRLNLKPSHRARLYERDNCRCVLCGSRERPEIGHLLSVAEGLRMGLSDAEINDDENLATMCAVCNSGLGDRPVSMRLLMLVLKARLHLKGGDDAHRS